MNFIPMIISTCALLFTVFSFWWMNWRRGKLVVYGPRTFCFATNNERVIVYIPLVFYNNGAAPIIVENLKLFILSPKYEDERPLIFQAIHKTLYPKNEERTFATQFIVNGRSSQFFICEFQRLPSGIVIDKEVNFEFKLSAKLGHKKEMCDLLTFSLPIRQDMIENIGHVIPYDKDSIL